MALNSSLKAHQMRLKFLFILSRENFSADMSMGDLLTTKNV